MKLRRAIAVWLFSIALFLGSAVLWKPMLPEHIATHFNAGGYPDCWMSRSHHMLLFVIYGIGLATIAPFMCFLLRFLPPGFFSVPQAAYWRTPEHYREACAFLLRAAFWFGAGFALWATLFHALLVEANHVSPPRLESGWLFLLLLAMLLGVAAWIGRCYWFFARRR